jgi:hypothetical protein
MKTYRVELTDEALADAGEAYSILDLARPLLVGGGSVLIPTPVRRDRF